MIRRNAHALNFLSSPPHERVIQFGMSGIQCPRCGREADGGGRFWRDGKPYCPACGWNVDRANTLGGKNQKLIAVYFVAIVLFLVGLGLAPGGASRKHPGSVLAFALVLAVMAAISWHRSKLQKPTQVSAIAAPASDTFGAPASPMLAAYERVLMLPRPRAIRMKTTIRVFATVYVLVLGAVAYAILVIVEKGGAKAAGSNAIPNFLPFAIFGLIWSIVAFTMFRSIARDRRLLSEGEIAVATVTSQSYAGGESRDSRITYTFRDAAGREYLGKGIDRTRKVFEEMRTPVFYDPLDPAKNVPLVGATYDIVDS